MSRSLFHSALVRRLLIYSILLGGIFVVLSTGWILFSSFQQHQLDIEENLDHIAQQTPGIASSLYVLDHQQIEIQLEGLLNIPGVVYLQVEEDINQNQLIISRGDPGVNRDAVRHYPLNILDLSGKVKEHLGQLTAVIDMEYVYQDLRLVALNAFVVSSVGIALIIMAVFLLFHFQVIRHLLSITAFTSQLDLDQLEKHLVLVNRKKSSSQDDEVGQLVNAINNMRTRLQEGLAEQKLSHNKLKMSEANLRALVETIPDLVWVKDPEGIYLMCNPRFEGLFGAKESEIVGKTDFDFVDDDLAIFFRRMDIEAIKNAGPKINEETVTFAIDGHKEILETVKSPMYDNQGKLLGILGISRDITERERYEKKLKLQDELLNEMGRLARIGGWEFDVKTGKGEWTEEVARIHDLDPDDQADVGIGLGYYQGENREHIETAIQQAIESAIPYDLVLTMVTPEGVEKIIRTIGHPLVQDDKVVKLRGSIQDITEQKQTERALQRSQKMDAVGQLTGGIAHDFNNILGIIIGNLDLLKIQIHDKKKALKRIETLHKSAQRASDLTRQLLGFSREQSAKIEVTDINKVINNMDSLITRSVTPQVVVEHLLATDLWLTEIDPGDFEDALLNLVLNARDVMSGDGQLTLETRNCSLDENYCRKNTDAKVGQYVQLAVSDSGMGIPQDLQDRIFEPFFTTKEQGKGTGLGLAMVYGFAKRSGGSVKVYSEPGIGTTFRLYMPRIDEKSVLEKNSGTTTELSPGGNEVLLVVDDEIDLLDLAEESLNLLGYKVITASDPDQALSKLEEHPEIDLLFSDVVMPGGMNGYELAELAVKQFSGLKVLLTSGYTQKVMARNGQARFDAMLLSKPYTQAELASRIREVLNLKLN